MSRPAETEFAPFYTAYISRVPEVDPLPVLKAQPAEIRAIADRIAPEDELFRYAPDKWSIKELVGHVIDTERIFAYRALRFARHDSTPLPGYEQDDYIRNATFDESSGKEAALSNGALAVASADFRLFLRQVKCLLSLR